MDELVYLKNDEPVCSSLQVAEKFGKEHRNVLQKRIYGDTDDVDIEFGWVGQDGFTEIGEEEIPFREKYLTEEEIRNECRKMVHDFKDATGTDEECMKLQAQTQKIFELSGKTSFAKEKLLSAMNQIDRKMTENQSRSSK